MLECSTADAPSYRLQGAEPMPTLLNELLADTIQRSLHLFVPELIVCATIVVMLLVRVFGLHRWLPARWVTVFGAMVAMAWALYQFVGLRQETLQPAVVFTGMLIVDQFTVFFRVFLLLALVLVTALSVLTEVPDDDDGADFYTLLLGSTLGMMLMAASNHLLMLFLSVEMTSVPSYVMVGFLKGRRRSSEAALKYVVYGAGAAGIMLYGVSLLAGLTGTANLHELAVRIGTLLSAGHVSLGDPILQTALLGVLFVFVGLAFKLSVVPFHFWCPDAFEGAAAEVAGFLSVASKAGAFALLTRFVLAILGDYQPVEVRHVYLVVGIGVGVIAAVTATFGNLAAYAQTNMKRLLAYSTIAHAGYMLMAVAALIVVLTGTAAPTFDVFAEAQRAVQGLLYYLSVYLFMNLGAFAVVAMIRNRLLSEDIDSYQGLAREMPVLCVVMAVCLFSLVGVPPLGGFVGKFMIFASLFQAGFVHWSMWAVLVIGGLNTLFSLFYYVRVLKVMFLGELPEQRPAAAMAASGSSAFAVLLAVPVLLLGVFVHRLSAAANEVAGTLFR
ncbi:MAG: NADH-quinone oxidoreductase subunit N [Planctomycetota bacterium]|nr:MAG: NADH-quinone oxidoreductase subunit N [Planctomycetota bacterium]